MSLYDEAVQHCTRIGDQESRVMFEALLTDEREHARTLGQWLREYQ